MEGLPIKFLLVFIVIQAASAFRVGPRGLKDACKTMKAGYRQRPETTPPPFHILIYDNNDILTSEYYPSKTLKGKDPNQQSV